MTRRGHAYPCNLRALSQEGLQRILRRLGTEKSALAAAQVQKVLRIVNTQVLKSERDQSCSMTAAFEVAAANPESQVWQLHLRHACIGGGSSLWRACFGCVLKSERAKLPAAAKTLYHLADTNDSCAGRCCILHAPTAITRIATAHAPC